MTDIDDLIIDLRHYKDTLHWRAADTIEALRAENAILKNKLGSSLDALAELKKALELALKDAIVELGGAE